MGIEKLKKLQQFEWDKWNINKIRQKHKVEPCECEEVFFAEDKIILKDILHSKKEGRFILLGKTKKDRLLFIVFTIRRHKIRVISARNVNKKERRLYEKAS